MKRRQKRPIDYYQITKRTHDLYKMPCYICKEIISKGQLYYKAKGRETHVDCIKK